MKTFKFAVNVSTDGTIEVQAENAELAMKAAREISFATVKFVIDPTRESEVVDYNIPLAATVTVKRFGANHD